MEDLSSKVAVITGGGSGIGAATGELLAQQGMRIVLADINEERLDETVAKHRAAGHETIGVVTDVADFDSVRALSTAAHDAFGGVDVLHLNAGVGAGGSFFDDGTDDWERVIGINLKGVIWGIKAFVPHMLERGEEGYVIATTSSAGAEGTAYKTASYAATKIAVVSIMESLYGQLRDQDSRLHVGVLFPPLAATNLAGSPDVMKHVEAALQSQGVPAALVSPEAVAQVVLDGIRRNRFFFRVSERERSAYFDGVVGKDFVEWCDSMMSRRAEAAIADGKPDDYLW